MEEKNLTPAEVSETPTVDLSMLNEDEKEVYQQSAGMSDSEISTLPPSLRKEISLIREKVAPPAAEVSETPTAEPEPDALAPAAGNLPDPTGDPQGGDTPAPSPEEQPPKSELMSDAEYIAMLEAELKKKNAQYSTLQGKYNAEIKAQRNNANAAAPSGTAPAAAGGGDAAAVDPNQQKFADYASRYDLGDDAIRAIAGIAGEENAALSRQIAAQEAELNNLRLDAAIFRRCGIHARDIENQPAFDSVASTLKNADNLDALTAIAQAKEAGDIDSMADIIGQVVDRLKTIGRWKSPDGYTVNAQTVPAPQAPVVPPQPAVAPAPAPAPAAPQPSAVMPHNASGVTNALSHTGRTAEEVEAEYDRLEKHRRKTGDNSVVPRMLQLSDEYSKLIAGKKV